MTLCKLFPFSCSHFLWKFLHFADFLCFVYSWDWYQLLRQRSLHWRAGDGTGSSSCSHSSTHSTWHRMQGSRKCVISVLLCFMIFCGEGRKQDNAPLPSYCATPTYKEIINNYLVVPANQYKPSIDFSQVVAQMPRRREAFWGAEL